MSEKDPKGYYKLLGVQPDAPASVIKAAYRALAMDLHPDRNPNKDTTSKFQALQGAYAALSDEKLRQQYDADSSIPNAEPTSGDKKYKPPDPIVCSKCSAVSAQPRYKVFWTVYAYVIGATRKPYQGVFCSKCEIKVALQSSAITLVTGWWSIAGFFWTCQTLLQNLVGGQFNLQNAQLQGFQAMYFAQIGKVDLARAIAEEALKLAEKAMKESNKQHGYRKSLGYDEIDPLNGLKETLTNFINAFPGDASAIKLRSRGGIFNKRFAFQSLLLLVFFGLVSGEIYRRDREATVAERVRLERQGIERARAAAIAEKEVEILKSMEMPLPRNGIYRVANLDSYNLSMSPPLKVMNSPDANTLMKLTRVSGAMLESCV